MSGREEVAAIWLARAEYHQERTIDSASALESETHQKIADHYTQLATELRGVPHERH